MSLGFSYFLVTLLSASDDLDLLLTASTKHLQRIQGEFLTRKRDYQHEYNYALLGQIINISLFKDIFIMLNVSNSLNIS